MSGSASFSATPTGKSPAFEQSCQASMWAFAPPLQGCVPESSSGGRSARQCPGTTHRWGVAKQPVEPFAAERHRALLLPAAHARQALAKQLVCGAGGRIRQCLLLTVRRPISNTFHDHSRTTAVALTGRRLPVQNPMALHARDAPGSSWIVVLRAFDPILAAASGTDMALLAGGACGRCEGRLEGTVKAMHLVAMLQAEAGNDPPKSTLGNVGQI